jgi:hypothetical protein
MERLSIGWSTSRTNNTRRYDAIRYTRWCPFCFGRMAGGPHGAGIPAVAAARVRPLIGVFWVAALAFTAAWSFDIRYSGPR